MSGDYVLPFDLPDGYYCRIGEIAARWSRVELLLQELVWAVMGLAPKDGRLLTAEQGAKDNFQTFKGLVRQSMPGRFPAAELEDIAGEVHRLMAQRNNIVHGVFGHAAGRPDVLELLYAQRRRDKVVMHAEPKPAGDLERVGADVAALQRALEELRARLESSTDR